jgi:hypothetical protein
MSKKLLDAIAERKAAGFSDDDDDVYDDDENIDAAASAYAAAAPPIGITAFHAAAVAATAPADASAAPADAAVAPPIEPYFGANGVARTRATSLLPLPGFETFRANSAPAPPLLSSAGQSTANYCTQLALVGGAIYCTRQRQVWICLIIYHHNTVNSSNDQYSNNTVINTQQRFINTIVDHH